MSSQVSVVIPAYNCANYLQAALESIFEQSYTPLEIIVVDDGSTDETQHLIRDYPQVIYIRQQNGGPSRARNTGIQRAKGPYIAFLDADDIWCPDKLNQQIAVMEANPEIGLVFSDMRNFSPDGGKEASVFEKYALDAGYFGSSQLIIDAATKLLAMNFIGTGTVVVREQVLQTVGAFDERLRLAEDWDLWIRIALRYPIAYIPSVGVLRRLHPSNTSRDTEEMAVAALNVLEKLKRKEKGAPSHLAINIDKHLRDGYRNLGYFYLRQTALSKARRTLWKSLSFGVQGRALLYFACTFLGRTAVGSVIRIRG